MEFPPDGFKPAPELGATQAGCVRLTVRGLGHIPALKNSMYAIVKPKNREWKRRCVVQLVSQLRSYIQIGESGTWTPDCPPCLIALLNQSMPFDDNRRQILEIHLYPKQVEKGLEGAEIVIKLIDK